MEAFIGEIRPFAFTYVPVPWLLCDGSVYSVLEYQALASVIGFAYGGDGQTTFAVPNLLGATMLGAGVGPGLSGYILGQVAGGAQVTLSRAQMPAHDHEPGAKTGASSATVDSTPAAGDRLTSFSYTNSGNYAVGRGYYTGFPNPNPATMAAAMIGSYGTGGPHENRQPYLPVQFCIAADGTYPVRPS